MNTPATTIAGGFFAQLMPMLADRTVMMIVSKADEQHLTVSVIPKRMKDGENAALATPFCCTGTPEELDRELPTQVRDFVAGHVALSANLAEIQHEREEAEKAAREELKKKQKTVGNGGARSKASEPKPKEDDKAVARPPLPPMLSLFDTPSEEKAEPPHPIAGGGGEEEEEEEEVRHASQSNAS
jgi:PRTRC genetic system protein E